MEHEVSLPYGEQLLILSHINPIYVFPSLLTFINFTYDIEFTLLQGGIFYERRYRWPSGLKRASAAARLLGLPFRIPSGAWVSVSCDCRLLSGRSICDGLKLRPVES